jgi:ketosteroid isomerase-like protein
MCVDVCLWWHAYREKETARDHPMEETGVPKAEAYNEAKGRGRVAMHAGGQRVIRTMCPMNCHPTLCGMLVEVEDGRLVQVRG